jgi:putative peptidoglycan lipid II flippase
LSGQKIFTVRNLYRGLPVAMARDAAYLMAMLRSMATVSGFTAMSRVLGFLRDILIARFLGAGMVSDAFFSAFRFPNLFRRIFGEGAFNSAFVPLFARELEENGKEKALHFASRTFSILALVLGVGTVAGIPLMAWIMSAVVPGFKAADASPVLAAGDTHEFQVNVKGARGVFIELKGDPGVMAVVASGTLSAPVDEAGIVEKIAGVLGTSRREIADEPLLNSAGLAPGATYLGASEPLEIRLPKGHNFTKLTGSVQLSPDSGGATLKVYRNHPGTFDLTVKLTQITFAYLMCMALVAHLSGVLNTAKIFGMPAAAPVLLNVVFLLGLLVVVPVMGWQKSPVQCGFVAATCVFVAGFVQLAALYITCRRKGLRVRLIKPSITPRVKRLFALMGPGVLSAGIQQINLLIGGIIASYQEGAVSYLYYSDRIYQLPLGMIGIAIGVVLLPDITRRLRSDDLEGARNSMNRAIELALLITLPAAVAMLVIPYPIVSTLFEHGKNFTAVESRETALALAGFAIGLPGYVLIRVLQPGFFARENTKSPMYMAGITVLVNIVISLLLFPTFRHVGIAVATAISAWVNVFLLLRGLRGFLVVDRQLKSRIWKILAASLLMGAALWSTLLVLGDWFAGSPWIRTAGLSILVLGGMAVYGACVIALRATSLREFKHGFKR